MARIVVVQDEAELAAAIAARLRSDGHLVSIAGDGPSAVQLISASRPDAVVLDLMLPGFAGLEVCRQIQRDRPVPVIMLTARGSETDLVVGLEPGHLRAVGREGDRNGIQRLARPSRRRDRTFVLASLETIRMLRTVRMMSP